MPDTPNQSVQSKAGFFARLGLSRKQYATAHVDPAREINEASSFLYGAGSTTVASLLGSGNRGARPRQAIYEKWMRMEGDPLISSALQLLVTAALGGHETSGDLVFIEKTAAAKEDKRLGAIVDEISAELAPLFNRVAFQAAYIGAAYGDAYARIYTTSRGVVDLCMDDLLRPQLVQPFERGSRTVGFAVSTGERNFERLDVSQLARLKMPRTVWVPQHGVVEKSLRSAIAEDDIDKLPIMPAMVGGSLLYNAEEPYDNLSASLLGLVGQRWMDSIDEQMVTVNLDSMTLEQQERFVESVKRMLLASKKYAEQAVKRGRPIMERIRHIIPVFNEKQLSTIGPANGGQSGRGATISIEDVMLHARLLSGSIGVDLSMLGFADQLAGGLGEGGIFRVSAHVAERARIIRVALSDLYNHVSDIHTLRRYGIVFKPQERPWVTNFFGSISALEAEKQRTRADSMNGGLLLVQSMQMLKEMGATKAVMSEFLEKTMMLDAAQAALYASIVDAKAQEEGNDSAAGASMPSNAKDGRALDSIDWASLDSSREQKGVLTSIPVPSKTIAWLGFQRPMMLRADLWTLHAKHPEHFEDTGALLSAIQFVMAGPDDWFIHKDARVAIFRKHPIQGVPLVRIEVERSGAGFIVRSVYSSTEAQISHKLNLKRKELERLGRSGDSYGSFTVAEYLSMLGAGSSRPVPPSGGHPKPR
jgi:hypothetical protein